MPPHPAKLLLKATMPYWLGALLLLVAAGITYSGWHRVRSRVMSAETYRFSPASVHVTETPPWVPETIVNDVVNDFNVGRARRETPIDQDLLKELAAAFRAYHWVESVDRVRASFPATVTLDLTYRTPICMVLLPNMAGGYAVDRHGVHLPSDYFTDNPEVDVSRYVKVLGVESMPTGNVGEKWGDPVVERAAALADHLAPDNSVLRIASIRHEPVVVNRRTTRHLFYLVTTRGTEIAWGEMPLEPNDSRKERLLELVHQYGLLEKAPRDENGMIRLR